MIDVEQVVVHGHLVLGVVVGALPEDGGVADDETLLAHLSGLAAEVAAAVGVRVDVESASDPEPAPAGGRPHHVILLGRPVPPDAVAGAARAIAGIGGNIDAIRRLSDYPVTSFELTVSGAEATALRTALASVAAATGADIAVEQVGLARRSKRLIVLDVGSHLVRGEVIDELAARAGRAAEVARITAAAMNGELDFAETLRARVGVLAGLPVEVLDEVREALELTPGARTLIRTLQRLGFRCGIVIGGFTQITDPLADTLGLDFAAANTLEVVDGKLTGGLVGDIVDRPGKARALERFAAEYGIPMEQTVAVGRRRQRPRHAQRRRARHRLQRQAVRARAGAHGPQPALPGRRAAGARLHPRRSPRRRPVIGGPMPGLPRRWAHHRAGSAPVHAVMPRDARGAPRRSGIA